MADNTSITTHNPTKSPKSNLKSKKRDPNPNSTTCSSSSSSSSMAVCGTSKERGLRVNSVRRKPRFLVRRRVNDVEAIAFPLGMSIAAVVTQVLEQQEATSNKMSAEHLSRICTSAVRESLANVFGDKFEPFAATFEKSFGSTLSTLRLIRDSTQKEADEVNLLSYQSHSSGGPSSITEDTERSSSKTLHVDASAATSYEAINNQEQLTNTVEVQVGDQSYTMGQELFVHRQIGRQLTSSSSDACNSFSDASDFSNVSVFNTWKKSVAEQTRANDLKTFEIGLIMKKLQLKETQLALNSDSNFLERCKLFIGTSKASFKAEKFKNQLEETKHAELLRKCIDCLVAGLLIMSASVMYATYIFSYKRIAEATLSCSDLVESKSWWFPKPMASLTSGMQSLQCQVQVLSRMLFGFLMILAVAYLLLQRAAAAPNQTMPITFILLLLGTACGYAGKMCLETLGGSGYHWLVYWEILCVVHFFANICTPILFDILHGPVRPCQGMQNRVMFPYSLRRILFYLVVLVVLPLLCGLMPFASIREWREHFFSSAIPETLQGTYDEF
ncbi:CPR-5-like protein [Drosera capensis]